MVGNLHLKHNRQAVMKISVDSPLYSFYLQPQGCYHLKEPIIQEAKGSHFESQPPHHYDPETMMGPTSLTYTLTRPK